MITTRARSVARQVLESSYSRQLHFGIVRHCWDCPSWHISGYQLYFRLVHTPTRQSRSKFAGRAVARSRGTSSIERRDSATTLQRELQKLGICPLFISVHDLIVVMADQVLVEAQLPPEVDDSAEEGHHVCGPHCPDWVPDGEQNDDNGSDGAPPPYPIVMAWGGPCHWLLLKEGIHILLDRVLLKDTHTGRVVYARLSRREKVFALAQYASCLLRNEPVVRNVIFDTITASIYDACETEGRLEAQNAGIDKKKRVPFCQKGWCALIHAGVSGGWLPRGGQLRGDCRFSVIL